MQNWQTVNINTANREAANTILYFYTANYALYYKRYTADYAWQVFSFKAEDVIVRPLSTVEYTSVVASVIHSRQWSN